MKIQDVKKQLFDEMKLPDLLAQALSKKLDIPYEELEKLIQQKFQNKINEAYSSLPNLNKIKDYNVENNMNIDEFIEGKKIIKG